MQVKHFGVPDELNMNPKLTDSDGDDSGLWCVPTKTTTMPSVSQTSWGCVVLLATG